MKAYLGLGGNLGDRGYYLRQAVAALKNSQEYIEIKAISGIYETEPWGDSEQPAYWNQVVEIETALAPLELLQVCQEIENKFGRKRNLHWGPRTIDIDLLIYDNMCWNTEQLRLPHPYLEKRAFVLAPLREIAPELVLPSGKPIAEVFGEGKVHPLTIQE